MSQTHHHHVIALAIAVTTLLSASPSTAEAEVSPWIGTWTATWPDGATRTELRIDAIEGTEVWGSYCHQDAGWPRKIDDLGGDAAIQPRLSDGALSWQTTGHKGAAKRWEFRLEDDTGPEMRFRFRNQHNRTHVVVLTRVEEPSPCLGQWVPQTESAATAQPVPPPGPDDNPWRGTWIGVWPGGAARTEFRIDRIDADGTLHGTLCHRNRNRPRVVWDIGPGLDIEAERVRGRSIRWKQTLSNGKQGHAFWVLARDGERIQNTLRYTRDRKKRTAKLLLTRYLQHCLHRWLPPTTP